MTRLYLTLPYRDHLRRRLAQLKLSQRQFGQLIGVKPPQVSRWMNGKAEPTLSSIGRIETQLRSYATFLRNNRRDETAV